MLKRERANKCLLFVFSSHLVVLLSLNVLVDFLIMIYTLFVRDYGLFLYLSPNITLQLDFTQSLSFHLHSISSHLFSVWLSLPCSPLFIRRLSPLVRSASFSLSIFISVLFVYSKPLLCFSHTQDSTCPPLYFSPHQSDVPIFPFIFLSCV